MSEQSVYQQARSHLAYLRMAAAAEALPAELEYAASQNLGHTSFLERLLDVEVTLPRPAAEPVSSASPRCPHRSGSVTSTSTLSRRSTGSW
jgi:hypothetical protein